MHFIYLLIDPETKIVRYVGKTKNPKSRFRQHLKDAEKRQNTLKQRWILSLKNRNLLPEMKIIKSFEKEEDARIEEEKQVIKNINTIYNIHLPGKGSKTVSFFKKTGKTK